MCEPRNFGGQAILKVISVFVAVLPCLKKDDDAPFTSSDISDSPQLRSSGESAEKNEEDKIADLMEGGG